MLTLLFLPLQSTNEVIYRVPKATQEEMLAAVDSCSRAYNSWSETSILARQQIFLRYQQLIKDNIVRQRFRQLQVQLFSFRTLDSANPVKSLLFLSHTHTHMLGGPKRLTLGILFQKELAKSITYEQGKTLADAEGDVFRGLRKFTSTA